MERSRLILAHGASAGDLVASTRLEKERKNNKMKIKHWQGYGCVDARRIKNASCTLHVRVQGNHECGLRRDDEYDLFNWLVKRFDKSVTDYAVWHRRHPKVFIVEWNNSTELGKHDTCDYYFTY